MNAGPSLYNPRGTRPEQLDSLLTGRTPLLEELLASLREQAQGTTRQHWLLRGQRGMGKTHLAGVIHHRVKTDPTLSSSYVPLWMGEADTYEVYSSATLLKTIGERLAEEKNDKALSARLSAVEGVGDEEGYFQEMVELLSGEAERRERVLLVLMENLDALLGSFDRKERKEQTRQLRSLLLHNPHFLFISTTPTYYLNNPLDDPKEPLYAHLKERTLDHLTEAETNQLLRKLSEAHPRPGAETFLDAEQGRLRLRVIHRLTGGLPRSIVMAFTAIREATGIGSLVQELRALLDSQTAYFEARLSQLPARERAIVTTMALAPTNLTMKEISTRSRLPERTLSTLMSRLEKDGHVRPTSRSGRKGAIYELSEGLFRLWYQYRKGRPVLEPLVEFLAYWYHAEELERVVMALRQSAGAEDAPLTAELALLQAEEALRRASSHEGKQERERLWAECQRTLWQEQIDAEVQEWAPAVRKQVSDTVRLLNEPEGREAAHTAIQHILQSKPFTNEQLLPALLSMLFGILTEQITPANIDKVQIVLSLVLEEFKGDKHPAVHAELARAHAYHALLLAHKQPQQALVEADIALGNVDSLQNRDRVLLHMARGIALSYTEQSSEAADLLEESITTFEKEPDPSSNAIILMLLIRLIDLHVSSGKKKDATLTRKRLIERFGQNQEEPFLYQVAYNRLSLAVQARYPKIIAALEEWLLEYGHIDRPRFHHLQDGTQLSLAALRTLEEVPLAHEPVATWVESVAKGLRSDVGPFFGQAVLLFSAFGPHLMKQWLEKLATAPLAEESRLLVSWHLMAAEILSAESDSPTGARSKRTPSSSWARIPPELRPNIEDLVNQVRKLRARVEKQSTVTD